MALQLVPIIKALSPIIQSAAGLATAVFAKRSSGNDRQRAQDLKTLAPQIQSDIESLKGALGEQAQLTEHLATQVKALAEELQRVSEGSEIRADITSLKEAESRSASAIQELAAKLAALSKDAIQSAHSYIVSVRKHIDLHGWPCSSAA